MEEMPCQNMSVQRLKVAILPLDLPCSGPVTHSRDILITGRSHGKKPDRFFNEGDWSSYGRHRYLKGYSLPPHWTPLWVTSSIQYIYNTTSKYRVIHKSLRDFRPLRYSSRDGHAEGEHVNRGRDTPSFCPILQALDMLTSEGSWQTFLAHARQSRPMAPAGLFFSQRTGSHSDGISCTTHELLCP